MVFEIVRALAENPNEILYGEGVLKSYPTGLDFCALQTITTYPLPKTSTSLLLRYGASTFKKGDTVTGPIRPPKDKEKYFALFKS